MFCPRCGKENPASLKFCKRCGAPLPQLEPKPARPSAPDDDGWSDGPQYVPEPASHQEPAYPQSHQEPARPQSHQESAQPQSHQEPGTNGKGGNASPNAPDGSYVPPVPTGSDVAPTQKSKWPTLLKVLAPLIVFGIIVSVVSSCIDAVGEIFDDSDETTTTSSDTNYSSGDEDDGSTGFFGSSDKKDTRDCRTRALDQAKGYVDSAGVSRDDLKSWMKDEYSDDDIQYAIDNCGADWKEEALQFAQNVVGIEGAGYSEQRLTKLIQGKGYTDDEVSYAMANVDVDWNEEALKCARSYRDNVDLEGDELRDQLKYEKFSDDQISYAMSHL